MGVCCSEVPRKGATYLHLVLDPGPNGIGLGSKLASQALIGVLASQLLLQGLVPHGHQLLHLSEPKDSRMRGQLRSHRSDHRMRGRRGSGSRGERESLLRGLVLTATWWL